MGVFIETGMTLMDCYPVAEKWLAECRLNQYPDGRMANIAPPNARPGYMTPMPLHVGRVGRCGDSGAVCDVQTHG